ncbi:Uncharacterised protein [Pseudomonas aeruginosa]|nr:Uncharacterised protein [Pseudomonas aeruginosa]
MQVGLAAGQQLGEQVGAHQPAGAGEQDVPWREQLGGVHGPTEIHVGGQAHVPLQLLGRFAVQRRRRFAGAPRQAGRQLAYARGAVDVVDVGTVAEASAQFAHQGGGQQGMAADLEEAVVQAEVGMPQHFLPGQGHLQFAGGAEALLVESFLALFLQASTQGLAVDLAVDRGRQAVQRQIAAGQHVVGQFLAQGGLDGGEHGPGIAAPLAGDHEGAQLLATAAWVGMRQHHRAMDRRLAQQRGFDVAEFDAVAADLHLVVQPTEELQAAVGQPAGLVAGAIEPAPQCLRVVEAPGGHVRVAQVFARQADARQVQLAGPVAMARPVVGVENECLATVDGRADRGGPPMSFGVDDAAGGEDRGFGRAVVIHHGIGQPAGCDRRQFFPGAEQVAQRQRRRSGLLHQRRDHHGRREGMADPLLGEECQQRRRVRAHLVGHQVEAGACAQGGPDFPLANVEADAGHQGGAAPLIHIEAPVVPVHEVAQGAALDHHAFGFAGGARGEDHIQRFAAVERRSRRGTRRTRRERLCDDLHRLPRQVLGLGGENHGGLALAEDFLLAPVGLPTVHRYVGRCALGGRQDGDDQFGRAFGQQGQQLAAGDAAPGQVGGQPVAEPVEFAVAERALAIDEGGAFGMGICVLPE